MELLTATYDVIYSYAPLSVLVLTVVALISHLTTPRIPLRWRVFWVVSIVLVPLVGAVAWLIAKARAQRAGTI